jgi:hypothetical protein
MKSFYGKRLAAVLRGTVPFLTLLLLLGLAPRSGMAPTPAVSPVDALMSSQDAFDRIVAEVTLRGLAQRAAETKELYWGGAAFCLHPDTKPEDAERILRELPTYIPDNGLLGYVVSTRWSTTASGTTGTQGNPITLTWGIVPDGTNADGGPSNLQAVFTAAWGGTGWMDKIRNAFVRWHAVIGITYIEVADDGASMPESPGVLGTRGDVRIGGRSIDGAGNVLAYDYYPNIGDMVLDTDDVAYFHNPIYNYGTLKNIVTHEHGHGIGLAHVNPNDCTKLMEPYACAPGNFIGPQDDDIRGGQRNYGDIYENNDTNATATVLGTITDSLIVETLSIDKGQTDVDWYTVTLTNTDIDIVVDPIGSGYYVGPDGGTQVWVQTDSISDLDIYLYDAAGTTLLASATSHGTGESEELAYTVPATGNYKIYVFRKASTGNDIQRYKMTVYSDAAAGVFTQADMSFAVYPNPFTSGTTARFLVPSAGAYHLDVFDVMGRSCRKIEGRANAAGWVEATWDGHNNRGDEVPAGVYFVRVSSDGREDTARVLLVR